MALFTVKSVLQDTRHRRTRSPGQKAPTLKTAIVHIVELEAATDASFVPGIPTGRLTLMVSDRHAFTIGKQFEVTLQPKEPSGVKP